ncbi:hypothetical protein [Maridesulfovibrio frigidus]|uniref:hypothetical protein n=1 Tax=Maridesulfovibrio frigidus TaxID=340956 RepID=UPI0004E2667E|nr:hypothetical protein [Maridesulfovibrio frigidus]
MKKASIILQLVIVSLLMTASLAMANKFEVDPLIKQALKVVPKGAELVASQGGEGSAFVAYTSGEQNYQFTLSSDLDPQIPDAKKFKYKDKDAFYFRPGAREIGGLMIVLNPEKSLVIIYSSITPENKKVTLEAMVKIADQMNLDKI